MARTGTITRVAGVRVGHATDPSASSGVTVAVFDRPCPTVIEVGGGTATTYDTSSLSLEATFGRRWALFFAGGSLFGLDAARGIRTHLLEAGKGHRVFGNPFPIVPVSGAVLFDLPRTLGPVPDYLALGYEAARSASRDPVPSGRDGAAAGATLGKYLGRSAAMAGGLASRARQLPAEGWVGTLVVLNSVGAIRDPVDGVWIAGARGPDGRVRPPRAPLRRRPSAPSFEGTNLVLVTTDIPLDRPTLQRVAALATTGLARVVVPAGTATDGDVTFAVSTRGAAGRRGNGMSDRLADRVGTLAAELTAEAAALAARAANSRLVPRDRPSK